MLSFIFFRSDLKYITLLLLCVSVGYTQEINDVKAKILVLKKDNFIVVKAQAENEGGWLKDELKYS